MAYQPAPGSSASSPSSHHFPPSSPSPQSQQQGGYWNDPSSSSSSNSTAQLPPASLMASSSSSSSLSVDSAGGGGMTLSLPLPTIQLSPQQLQQLLAQFQQYTAHQQQQQQQQQPAQPPQPQQHHGGGSGSAFQPPSYNPLSFQQTPSAPPAQPAPAPPVQPQPQSFSSSSPPFNFVMQPSAFSSPSSGQNGPFSPIRQPQPQHQQHQQQQQQQSPASSAQPSTPSSPPQQLQFYPSMPSPYYAGYMPQQPQQLYAQSAGSSSSSSAAASQSQSASSLPSMTPSSLSFVPNSGVAIPTPVVMASASTAAGSASSYSAVHHARNKQARHNPVMGPVASASAPAAAASSLPSLRSPSAGFPSSVMSNPNIVRAIQSGLVNTRPAGAEAAAAAAGAWSDKSRSVSRPTSSSSHPPFELLKTESKRPYATLLYSVNRRMLPSYISKRPSAPAPASPTSSAPSSSPASPASTSASGSASASSPVSPAAAASPLSRSPDMTTIKIRVMTLRVPPPNALPLTSELFFVAADISAIIHSRKSNIAKAVSSFPDDEKKRASVLCMQANGTVSTHSLTVLSWRGVERLLNFSCAPVALPFLDWIRGKVKEIARTDDADDNHSNQQQQPQLDEAAASSVSLLREKENGSISEPSPPLALPPAL